MIRDLPLAGAARATTSDSARQPIPVRGVDKMRLTGTVPEITADTSASPPEGENNSATR